MRRKLRERSRTFEEYSTLVCSFLVNTLLYRRKNLASADIRRIVIIKLDHIGDLILSIPAINSLKRHFPKSHITIVVNPSSAEIAGYIPAVDEVLTYDARFFSRSDETGILDFDRGLKFARKMRNMDFDLIVELRGSFASLAFALVTKSKYRIDRGTYLVKRKSGRISNAFEHEAEVNLHMLNCAGIDTSPDSPPLKLKKSDIESALSLLRECGNPDQNSPLVVIHPGPPAELKRWPAERYARLADRLKREYNARIVLIGGKGEDHIASSIASALDNKITNLSGKTTLGQLAAILKEADLFIGNDSGPMHLAGACGIKAIGLFGPTSPKRFGPYGDRCKALRMETECPPCMRDECKTPGRRCIDRISVDDVIEAIKQMMPLC